MKWFSILSRDWWNPSVEEPRFRTDEHGYTWADTEYFGFGDFAIAKDQLGLNFPSAEEYIRLHGDQYPWRDEWLRQGKTFTAPSREFCLKIKKARGHIPGNCYNNALRLALGMEGKVVLSKRPRQILYGEGMAIHPTGPHLHAWLVIDGELYDPTWPDAFRANYFGIAVDPKWMLNFAETVGKVSLLQNWSSTKNHLSSLFAPKHASA